mmetsp:Transcript_57740/g.136051  ORF Transcript_57740/g.136051 Transcript_57740/m.136051 type:complete len:158 (-) Transcript_57740:59-532(-)
MTPPMFCRERNVDQVRRPTSVVKHSSRLDRSWATASVCPTRTVSSSLCMSALQSSLVVCQIPFVVVCCHLSSVVFWRLFPDYPPVPVCVRGLVVTLPGASMARAEKPHGREHKSFRQATTDDDAMTDRDRDDERQAKTTIDGRGQATKEMTGNDDRC